MANRYAHSQHALQPGFLCQGYPWLVPSEQISPHHSQGRGKRGDTASSLCREARVPRPPWGTGRGELPWKHLSGPWIRGMHHPRSHRVTLGINSALKGHSPGQWTYGRSWVQTNKQAALVLDKESEGNGRSACWVLAGLEIVLTWLTNSPQVSPSSAHSSVWSDQSQTPCSRLGTWRQLRSSLSALELEDTQYSLGGEWAVRREKETQIRTKGTVALQAGLCLPLCSPPPFSLTVL